MLNDPIFMLMILLIIVGCVAIINAMLKKNRNKRL